MKNSNFFRLVTSSFVLFLFMQVCLHATAQDANPANSAEQKDVGAKVAYELPTDGPLPKTYLVTLAIVDPKNPDWIVSTFVAGQARTVTEENKGKFIETWNGLDENYMPIPPGEYSVKGIFSPAQKWPVDEQWHAIVPKYAGALSGWWPYVDAPQEKLKSPFGGDPVSSPFGDVAVGPNGVAVFYYQYLENGKNLPMVDLKKPGVTPDQFIQAFNSGGAGGGQNVTTDGESVWACSTDGGPKYVYRADGKTFGSSPNANRRNSYLPEGWVTGISCMRNSAGKALVYVAQRGKVDNEDVKKGNRIRQKYTESADEFVNKITVHNGDNGEILGSIPITYPISITVQGGRIYALNKDESGYHVLSAKLNDGLPIKDSSWEKVFDAPEKMNPFDLKVDSKNRFYLSEPSTNKVYQLDAKGKIIRSFGKESAQKPGTYDPMTLMGPTKLATWLTPDGKDRLIIVESEGPNRVAEWDPETGALLRDFQTYQTFTNNSGYGIDPENPEDMYIQGQRGWLNRFKIDYAKHTFKIDAVWPMKKIDDPRINSSRDHDLGKMSVIKLNKTVYICGSQTGLVYRITPDRCALSAAVLKEGTGKDTKYSFWHDSNDNGKVDDDETTPASMPGHMFSYHGQNWGADLSFLAIQQGSQDAWMLPPSGFDQHGNPIFKEWKKVLRDPIFEAKEAGKADAIHGGNEMGTRFSSDWMQMDGLPSEGYYVQARSGKNFNANEGTEHKVSRYVPAGDGTYKLKWRVGRTALQWTARSGEIYGAMRIRRPINGILPVLDNSRCGVILYNEDGMYVDTLFPDIKRTSKEQAGLYLLPGEYFTGSIVPNKNDGKIYFAFGKYTPLLFEAVGWSTKENPVKPISAIQKTVSIDSSQIAVPPAIAISLRGGAGEAMWAQFAPALGGVSLDGSMDGWETAEPVKFKSGTDSSVEVHCMYDPSHIYLRWHARMGAKFQAKPLPPLPRIFTHDVEASTLDFYIQGNPSAKPNGKEGRPGDARFTFGIFKSGDKTEPVGIGMYSSWEGKGASPQTYRTPVRTVSYAHVGAIEGAQYGYAIDKDEKGFVIAVSIPRSAIPAVQKPFGADFKTLVNFSANIGGHNKYWWSNCDGSASTDTYDEPSEAGLYPGSWSPISLLGLSNGVPVRNWLVCGPFGGEEMKKMNWNLHEEQKKELRKFMASAKYPPDDGIVDLKAVFKGDIIQGYWNDPKQVSWKPRSIADLDTRVYLGKASELWYGSSWIYAPESTEVELEFQCKPQNNVEWRFNNEVIKLGKSKEIATQKHAASKNVTLKQGWNQIWFRTYCEGYNLQVGTVLKAPPEKLWTLKFSGEPPKDK